MKIYKVWLVLMSTFHAAMHHKVVPWLIISLPL